MSNDRTKRIALLNDLCRQRVGGQTRITAGIAALSADDKLAIRRMVRDYTDFTPDNDPHDERDFGAFTYGGKQIFWKIDYYSPDLKDGSEDPADPKKTARVLTIMLADEY